MGFQRTDVEALSSALGEPGWVLDSRLAAWDTFSKLELPGEKDEPWRYTDLRRLRFNLDAFKPIPPDPGREITDLQLELISQEQSRAGYVIQRDTDVVKVELNADLAKRGVILTDLGTAIREYPELVRPYLHSEADHSGHIFDALQVALSSGGTFLYVPRGVTVELPIESQRWIDEPGSAVFPRTLVVAEEGAEVTYIERLRSTELESPSLCNAAVEVFAGQASRVNLVTLQELGPQVWHFANNRYKTERDVNLRSLILTLGSRFSRN
ncbi:MAG TPA: SufD family Fe-S cluster assembly protein, partial [Actinomycetota bacterium]|nr:SufD family Fe-S cluster assembly protein [Actinomycetota bacterium]